MILWWHFGHGYLRCTAPYVVPDGSILVSHNVYRAVHPWDQGWVEGIKERLLATRPEIGKRIKIRTAELAEELEELGLNPLAVLWMVIIHSDLNNDA